ncbi:MAG: glutathione S-transferase family protein [Gluconacetobacter diazotrophicus]|nr:glutathione S-transferase family protein [Gluconacetobacter diazotrophicus]
MTITITAFERSPDGGRGLARDMRVRWALEEVGVPYAVRTLSFAAMKEDGHRALHPFGQIPTLEDGELRLFESGAIVLHVAERHAGLLPNDANGRARAIGWMFAALNTVEPPIVEYGSAWREGRGEDWFARRGPVLADRVRERLRELAARIGGNEWLEGDFSAADLLMVTVLRRLGATGLLEEQPELVAYVSRGTARPAYGRAFRAQAAAGGGG